jgi:hypothetical protein
MIWGTVRIMSSGNSAEVRAMIEVPKMANAAYTSKGLSLKILGRILHIRIKKASREYRPEIAEPSPLMLFILFFVP